MVAQWISYTESYTTSDGYSLPFVPSLACFSPFSARRPSQQYTRLQVSIETTCLRLFKISGHLSLSFLPESACRLTLARSYQTAHVVSRRFTFAAGMPSRLTFSLYRSGTILRFRLDFQAVSRMLGLLNTVRGFMMASGLQGTANRSLDTTPVVRGQRCELPLPYGWSLRRAVTGHKFTIISLMACRHQAANFCVNSLTLTSFAANRSYLIWLWDSSSWSVRLHGHIAQLLSACTTCLGAAACIRL